MRSRSLARSLALFLAVAPSAALADPPAPAPTSPPATTTAAPKPAPPAAKPPPPLPKAGAAPKPVAGAAAHTAKAAPRGKTAKVDKKKKKGAKDAPITGPIATYPGFRMLDGGGSRVFVTLSKKVAITETKAAGKLTYKIQGVQVPTRTNRLALVTTFFATPVSRVELVERDADVDLVIEVKDATGAQYRIVENDRGAELQVDFPKVAMDPADTAAPSDGGSAAPASEGRPAAAKSLESKSDNAY